MWLFFLVIVPCCPHLQLNVSVQMSTVRQFDVQPTKILHTRYVQLQLTTVRWSLLCSWSSWWPCSRPCLTPVQKCVKIRLALYFHPITFIFFKSQLKPMISMSPTKAQMPLNVYLYYWHSLYGYCIKWTPMVDCFGKSDSLSPLWSLSPQLP